MKSLITGVITLILALWVVAIAILSIQNVFVVDATETATLVSLKFLGASSIQLPLGILIALSAALGMVVTAIVLLLLRSSLVPRKRSKPSSPHRTNESH